MTSDFTGASYSEQPALLSRHHRGTTCFLSTSSVHCCKRFDICLFSPPCSFEGNYVPGYASSGFLATSGMFASRIVFLPSRKRKIIVDIGTFFANATLRTASQHSTPQYSRAQHSTAQHSIAQHKYSTVHYSTAQNSTAQYRTVPYRTVPYRTVPYRTVPYRTVPYSSIQFNYSL